MMNWYLNSRVLLRRIREKAVDAFMTCGASLKTGASSKINEYIKSDFEELKVHWHSKFPDERFGDLPRHISWGCVNDFRDMVFWDIPAMEQKLDDYVAAYWRDRPSPREDPYVADARVAEIRNIQTSKFDTTKLLQLIYELNFAYKNDNILSVGILLRAIIDHVPPVFGFSTFLEVVNNYNGAKSFKGSMKRLNDSLRNLADGYLHLQIRRTESLPAMVQVDFRPELDALLSEVVRLLRES